MQHIRSCDYQSIVISDHAPLTLSLSIPPSPPGGGQWCFNSTLLSDENLKKKCQNEIRFFFATISSQDTSSLVVWDAFKAYIRGQVIAYLAKMIKQSIQEQNNLMQEIKEIDVKYAHSQFPELLKKLVELKTRLELLTTHSAERLLMHDKSKFYVHGDKPNKLLATLLKGSRARQNIPKIRKQDGGVVTDHGKINDAFRDFFSELYSSQSKTNSKMMTS